MTGENRVRVLGIVGSPRRGGNTDILIDEVLVGAEEAGAATEKVYLSKLNIRPCMGCDACFEKGRCVLNDDMAELLGKMNESSVWVFGTPVYYWGPTAQFKTFVDRWYGTENHAAPKIAEFGGKKVILAVPLGGTERDARHTVGMIADALDYKKAELFASIIASGTEERGAVLENAELLNQARRAGRDAAAASKPAKILA